MQFHAINHAPLTCGTIRCAAAIVVITGYSPARGLHDDQVRGSAHRLRGRGLLQLRQGERREEGPRRAGLQRGIAAARCRD